MDFVIRKDLYGSWWHDYNNDATKVNISDFNCVIDEVANTFVIQCFNGSNVPNKAISISNVKVIDQSIDNNPIPFSGAVGLKNLLTTKLYPPFRDGTVIYDQKVIWRKGQAVLWNETQEYFDNNFNETGLGIALADGWALCNGSNGTKNFKDKFILNKGESYPTLYTNGGSANSVLIAHKHDSIEFNDGQKSVNDSGVGSTILGKIASFVSGTQKVNRTSTKGIASNGADAPSEDGVGKNLPPYIVAQWVERTEDLIVYYTGSEGGTTPNLTQVVTQGDLLLNYLGIETDTFTTFALNDRLTENIYDTQNATTGGLFLDKDVVFPLYSTIRFQAGFIGSSSEESATLKPYKFTTDAIVFYQGVAVANIILQPTDYCILKCSGDDGSGIQIWTLTVVNKSSGGQMSSVSVKDRCPASTFENAHGNLVIGTTQYYGTRTNPPELVKFPNPDDLTDFQKITLGSSSFGSIEYLAYNETLGKIYACLNTDKLLVINDIDDISDYDIIDIALSVGSFNNAAVVLTDDTYIYIGTAEVGNAHFIKLDASDYSEVQIEEWTGRGLIHSGVWNSDKSAIGFVQSGAVCYGAKVNASDLSYTDVYVGINITDDTAYMLDLGVSFNEYIYCPSEQRTFDNVGGYLWDFTDMVSYPIDALPATGCYFDYDNLMLYVSGMNGTIETWTAENLYNSALKIKNPKTLSNVYVYDKKRVLNEIVKIGNDFFVTIWQNPDAVGSLMKVDLLKVDNGAISKTEEIIRSERVFNAKFQGSVSAVNFITITFAFSDWDTLYNDYVPTVVAKNSASANALTGSWISNLTPETFRLNFASPVTATLDYSVTITP